MTALRATRIDNPIPIIRPPGAAGQNQGLSLSSPGFRHELT
jgi:hypothetical protein